MSQEDEPAEREIMPGVYITDFRRQDRKQADDDDTNATPEELEQQLKQLQSELVEAQARVAEQGQRAQKRAQDGSASGSGDDAPRGAGALEVLLFEIAQAENDLMHLLNSQLELERALRTSPNDPDFLDAFNQNGAYVQRKEERIAFLRKMVVEVAGGGTHALPLVNAGLTTARNAYQTMMAQRSGSSGSAGSSTTNTTRGSTQSGANQSDDISGIRLSSSSSSSTATSSSSSSSSDGESGVFL